MKKMIAMMMALCMAFCLGGAAWAAGPTPQPGSGENGMGGDTTVRIWITDGKQVIEGDDNPVLTVKVVDESGKPVRGASVVLRFVSPRLDLENTFVQEMNGKTTTGADGEMLYKVFGPNSAEIEYYLMAGAPGYSELTTDPFSINFEVSGTIELVLKKGESELKWDNAKDEEGNPTDEPLPTIPQGTPGAGSAVIKILRTQENNDLGVKIYKWLPMLTQDGAPLSAEDMQTLDWSYRFLTTADSTTYAFGSAVSVPTAELDGEFELKQGSTVYAAYDISTGEITAKKSCVVQLTAALRTKPEVSASVVLIIPGDINLDGKVALGDAQLIAAFLWESRAFGYYASQLATMGVDDKLSQKIWPTMGDYQKIVNMYMDVISSN